MKVLGILIIGLGLGSSAAYANFGDALVGGVVGGAVGSVVTNEIYRSNQPPPRSSYRHHRKKSKKRHRSAPKITNEMKIQKALSSLGFYHGKIDGELNSYETRSAIKELNKTYRISSSASLKPEEKDTLIYLGTLFDFDRYLIAKGEDKHTRGKRIQAALKILGFYHSKIDGAVGGGTRRAITEYNNAYGLGYDNSLGYEGEYQLIKKAREMNDKNIDEALADLKKMGTPLPIQKNMQEKQPVRLVPAEKPAAIPEIPVSKGGGISNDTEQKNGNIQAPKTGIGAE